MTDNSLVVVALVGLAVVCLGLVFVAFVLLLRFAGSRPLGFLSMLFGDRDNEREGGRIVTTPKPDLRAIAEANDFDAALAKHIVQDELEPQMLRRGQTPPTAPAPAAPAESMFGETPRLEPRERRGNVRRDDDDDLFGDMLE